MKKIVLKVFKNKFVRNVIILASGTAGAQALGMLFSPIITRIYGPDAYGVMGTFISMANIIIPVAALSYPIAIVLPKENRDAKELIRLSLIITIVLSLISLIILILFSSTIESIFNLKEIGDFLFLIPLVIAFAGMMQVMEQWLIRTKQFSINARVTFLQSLITNIGKVSVGWFYPVAIVLVTFTALENGIKGFMMFLFNKESIKHPTNETIDNKQQLKKVAKKHYDFPLFRAPEQFLNATSNSLPILMLTAFFGPASAGFYTIGRTVLRLPTRLIGKSVGDVFYPRIAEAYNQNENVASLIKKATFTLAGVGIIPYGLIVLLGPQLFSIVFGADWYVAGEYARWLAFWSFFGFINRPSVHSLAVLGAQKFHLIYTIIMLTTRMAVLAIGYYVFSNDVVAVALFGITGGLLNIGLITFTLRICRQRMNES